MRLRPVGEDSLLVDLDTREQAQAWHAELRNWCGAATPAPVREIVPGEKTVLLYGVADTRAVEAELRQWSVPPLAFGSGPVLDIPVHYDGADLAAVADLWAVTEDEVVRVHSGIEHRVAFCGFSPGFAYLTGLDDAHHVPRHPAPRTSVPAGSVALAGPYTGIYPRASPGGWQLIGTTHVRPWDMEREPAALLTPGMRVRFIPQEPGSKNTDGPARAREAGRRVA